MNKLKSTFLLLIIVFSCLPIKAQVYGTNPFSGLYFQPKFSIGGAANVNFEDFLLDFNVGFEDVGYDYSVSISTLFRPFYKTVFLEESNHYYYQAKEKIWQISIDLEKRFYFLAYSNEKRTGKLGLYILGKVGYFWGDYKGFKKSRNKTFAINPGVGFSWQDNEKVRLSVGYLYFNQNPFSSPHMVQFKIVGLIGKNRDKHD